jgi:AAA+ ATPase superfamily predicted ATPase
MDIVGRRSELEYLERVYASGKPEFIALYGRRRVGKTYLIKEFFRNRFFFYVTGEANADMKTQLSHFDDALSAYGHTSSGKSVSWNEAFKQLRTLIEQSKSETKKVIFLDELSWLDTHKSKFLSALEYFWNSFASSREDILLIVCGSATSWMIKNVIRDHGGLYNRITGQIELQPFTLHECEQYLTKQGIVMSRYHIVECYMIFGGIPYYLSMLEKQKSLAQNVTDICFGTTGRLTEEYANLFVSLFSRPEKHERIVAALSKKRKGLTREEIVELSGLPNGGGVSAALKELTQCGFIRLYKAFGQKTKGAMYQLIDPFTLFHLNYIKRYRDADGFFWQGFASGGAHGAWSGYAFELVCLLHIAQIKSKLGITGVVTHTSSWQGEHNGNKTQIDLLIDRDDGVINLCEMKYANGEFVITADYDKKLRNRTELFRSAANTRKAIHLTFVSTYGLAPNKYRDIAQAEVTMDDLFGG